MIQKEINRMHLAHLGKIFFNFSILGVALVLFHLLVPLALLPFAMTAEAMMMMPILWIFIMAGAGSCEDLNGSFGGPNPLYYLKDMLNVCLPYFAAFTIAVAALSILFLILGKTKKHNVKITASIIFSVISVFAIIVYYAAVGYTE